MVSLFAGCVIVTGGAQKRTAMSSMATSLPEVLPEVTLFMNLTFTLSIPVGTLN
jgi:hypothetical protein